MRKEFGDAVLDRALESGVEDVVRYGGWTKCDGGMHSEEGFKEEGIERTTWIGGDGYVCGSCMEEDLLPVS